MADPEALELATPPPAAVSICRPDVTMDTPL
jgi:hypothetical protein